MAHPILYCPRIVPSVGQGVAAGVAQHVDVHREARSGALAYALYKAIDGIGCEGAPTLGREHERRVRNQYQQYINESHKLALETRNLLFRGIQLENGRQIGGKKEYISPEDDPNRGKLLFWFTDQISPLNKVLTQDRE